MKKNNKVAEKGAPLKVMLILQCHRERSRCATGFIYSLTKNQDYGNKDESLQRDYP
jgi:hypothetical protein